MDEIKIEIESSLNVVCHGCLSIDRRVLGLGAYSDMFLYLVANHEQTVTYDVEDIKLCWECIALLKKFKSFQRQLNKAQKMLKQMTYGLDCNPEILSKLTIAKLSYFNQDYQYLGSTLTTKEESNETDQKIFIDIIPVEDCNKTEMGNLVDISTKEEKCINSYNSFIECNNGYDSFFDEEVSDTKDDVYDYKDTSDKDANFIAKMNVNTESTSTNENDKLGAETKRVRAKRRKLIKSRDNSVSSYKKYTRLLEREAIDFGAIEDYFTMTTFGEAEMEEHFLSKERMFSEVSKYELKCELCKLGFMTGFDLKRHNDLNHQNGGPYKCSHCLKRQPSQEALEAHWRAHTPVAKCKKCGDFCRTRAMKRHLYYAHTNKYACKFCNLTFGKILHFSIHYKAMHQNYICDYCKQTRRSKTLIEKHIRTNHTTFTCIDCNRQYPSHRHFKRHNDEKHPKHKPELAYCVECNKQYANIRKYKKHLQTRKHKGTRVKITSKKRASASKPNNIAKPSQSKASTQETSCPDCGKIFLRECYMRTHYDLKHLKKSKFYCQQCDKYFYTGFGLKYHTDYVHKKLPKVKDKICDLCEKAFFSKKTMLNHRRTHTGERPHKCPYCAARFIQKYAMRTHMRTKHKCEQINNETTTQIIEEINNLKT